MNDRLAGLIAAPLFLAIGAGQIVMALRLPGGIGLSAAEPGPGLFPMIVGALMCVASAAYLVQSLRADSGTPGVPHRAPVDIALLAGSIAAYILLLPRVGFVLSAFLLLLGTLSIYGMPRLWMRVATAAAATAAAWLVFTKGLGVNMPAPAWFN